MGKINLNAQIDAPLEKVFSAYSDFPNAANRIEGINSVEMLSDGPVGVGTRFRETRTMFGREATEEMEITRFEANKLYTVSADSCGMKFDTTFRFTQQSGSTRVEMQMDSKPVTVMAKLMTPIGWLMTGTMKKCMQADIDQMKEFCEKP